jgi:uncharacterized repeat protein (TIGR02543 family)
MKKIPALILSVIMVIAMMPILPGGMQETYAADGITANNGDTDTSSWQDGVYTVSGNVTLSERVTVTGDVTLNLSEGANLICSKGIEVANKNRLTINGPGTLTADPPGEGAGIGGTGNANSGSNDCGYVTINGGTIKATGSNWAAGIGGSTSGSGGTVIINGGDITATAVGAGNQVAIGKGSYDLSIGDVSSGKAGSVTISGGIIHATDGGSRELYYRTYQTPGDGYTYTCYVDGSKVDSLSGLQKEGGRTYTIKVLKNYKISYDLNNGTNSTANPTTYTVETEDIKLEDPTRTGWTFEGWYTDAALANKVGEVAIPKGSTGDKTYYAKWTPNTYTVKFDGNGGTGTMSDMLMQYDAEKNLNVNGFTRAGYTFSGWNTKNNGSGDTYADKESVNNLTAVNGGTVTLYAQWTPIDYTIHYELNGGTNAKTNSSTYTIESNDITLADPEKEGYTFDGWYGKDDFSGDKITKIAKGSTGDKNLYAKWTPNSYAVKFDANGGSGTMSNMSMQYDESQDLTANGFTRAGYTFSGWNTEKDGSGNKYADKASVKNLTAEKNGIVTLYAQWTAIPPSTYEPTVTPSDNGQTTVDKKDPEAGETVKITPTPNDGYEVDSVTVTDKDGKPVDVTKNSDGTYSFKQPEGSVTITVTYKKNEPVTPVVTTNPILNLKAVPAGNRTEKLIWTKVNGAEGYDVYFAKCGNKFRKIKSTKALTLKKTRLKKGSTYKYKVRAYKTVDGKKVYITSAYVSHAIAGGYNRKYTDAKSIRAAKKSITLEAGKTSTVKAVQTKLKKNRRFLRTSHAQLFRYASTDKSVATVDKNGKVTAKNAGTCTIYIYAQNGLETATTIVVK